MLSDTIAGAVGRLAALALVALLALGLLVSTAACTESRLKSVRQRGFLVCGIWPVAGFAHGDGQGRYAGFDVDVCRAMSAAIFGSAEQIRYVEVASAAQFLRSNEIDVVARRLTWSLQREGLGLLFGPVTFYDGQGFLISRRRQVSHIDRLPHPRICVIPGNINQVNLDAYIQTRHLAAQTVFLQSLSEVEDTLSSGRCDAFTADVSELGAVRSTMHSPDDFEILPEQVSKEPMGAVVRQGDDQFFSILRWTVFAMITAEELGVTSANVTEKLRSDDLDVKRLLGVLPGNGRALGLDENWAYNIIKTVGNYAEVYERNVGMQSPLRLARGLNSLWTDGGLMYAPLVRQ